MDSDNLPPLSFCHKEATRKEDVAIESLIHGAIPVEARYSPEIFTV
jgi:hypothetical protein